MFTIGGTSNRGFYPFEPTGSLRFEDGDSPYLARTPASAGNRKTFTFSAWVKRANIGSTMALFGAGSSTAPNYCSLRFESGNQLRYVIGGTTYGDIKTNAVFRDGSSWYHIVLSVDTTQATAADRVSIYINGTEQTSLATSTYPSQNREVNFNRTVAHHVGSQVTSITSSYFDGMMSDVYFIDGTAHDADTFAESKNGVWVPKDAKGSLTFGTNGFYLPFNSTVTAEGQSTVLYEGTGANRSVEGFGYKPDMVWLKNRTGTAYQHQMYDRVRGSGAKILPSTDAAQSLDGTGVHSFNDDGISIGTNAGINTSGSKHVSWAWDAGADQTPTGFGCVTYTGSGTRRPVRDIGFTPDLVWIKDRDAANFHQLFDSVRGPNKYLSSNTTNAEATDTDRLISFDDDGWTNGGDNNINKSGTDYVAWCWDAGDGDPVSNTDGSTTTTVKASDAHGFSIATYQGNGTVGNTIGHGLNGTPDVMWIKGLDNAQDWQIYHKSLSATTKGLKLNSTAAEHQPFQANQMTATTMGLDSSSSMNGNGLDYVAYFWKEVSGYSKFGSYSGTGSAGNAVTGLGFRPAWVMVKRTDSTSNWAIYDNTRSSFDPRRKNVWANLSDFEYDNSAYDIDFDADGFTLQTSDNQRNASGGTYIYMAFSGGLDTIAPVNTDGDIDSRVKASDDTGFSVVRYQGNGSAATIGHGLSSAPDWVLIKRTDAADNWVAYHTGLTDASYYLTLDTTNAEASNNVVFNSTAPTSSVFSVGTSRSTSGADFIAYCWTATTGKSAFGKYTGNGNSGASGPSITGLGFEPGIVIIKNIDSANGWVMIDNYRDATITDKYHRLLADSSAAEVTDSSTIAKVKFTSDGFDVTGGDGTLVNTNGDEYIYMAFADGRDSSFFHDESGQDNHFEPENVQNYDVVPDSPTNSWCTLNPLTNSDSVNLKEGSLEFTADTSSRNVQGTMAVSSGKWYFESKMLSGGAASNGYNVGVATAGCANITTNPSSLSGGIPSGEALNSVDSRQYFYSNDGGSLSYSSSSTAFVAGDIIGVALDLDSATQTVSFYKNGTIIGSAQTLAHQGDTWLPHLYSASTTNTPRIMNFGQDDSFGGTVTPGGYTDANERGSFKYPVPDGFLSLCTANLPEPDISPANGQEPADYFNTVLYAGDDTTSNAITGVGFQPDFTWIKARNSGALSHGLFDSVRGANKTLFSDVTNAESSAVVFPSFDSDGFTVSDSGGNWTNDSFNYVSWNWLAGGTAVSNTDGSVTSSVSANTKAGFSVCKWTGTGSNLTVGHGLGVAPKAYIVKRIDGTSSWHMYHDALGNGKGIQLSGTGDAISLSTYWNSTSPTSSVFSIGTYSNVNTSSANYIAYVFAEVEGYSKFGSYTANNTDDNAFVYLGFRPAWVMCKSSSGGGNHFDWVIYDNKRADDNPIDAVLEANQSQAEVTGTGRGLQLDFLSNGFKIRNSYAEVGSSYTYIYIAFAEMPFKYAQAR